MVINKKNLKSQPIMGNDTNLINVGSDAAANLYAETFEQRTQ